MATTNDEAAVYRLFAFLNDFGNVAIKAQSTEDYSREVLQILLNRFHQFGLSQGGGLQLTFAEFKRIVQAVVRGTNISQLATDTQTPEDHVGRIVGVIVAASNANWGQFLGVNQLVHPGTNLHSFFVPIPRSAASREYLHWPESIPQHASQLRRSFDSLSNARHPSQQTGYNISVRDFDTLKDGITLLDQKITTAFGQILDGLPPYQRPQFAAESWYISPYQRFLNAQNLANRDPFANTACMAPNMASNMGNSMASNMGTNMAFNMPANTTSDMAFRATHSQPRGMNQVRYFPAQGNNARHPILSRPGQIRQHSTIPQAMPFATPVVHSLGQNPIGMQPVTSKHTLAHSPGKSPVKKKARETPMSAVQQPAENLARTDTPYAFFVLAERDNLMDDLTEEQSGLRGGVTGQELTNLVFRIWTMMTAKDKAPFEAACQKWREQQPKENEALASNEDNPDVHDLTQEKKREELVDDIKRCRIVLNAATLCRTLRNQALANNASRNLARASIGRPLNAPMYPIPASSTLLAWSSLGLASRAVPVMVFRPSASQAFTRALSHEEMVEQPRRKNAGMREMMNNSARQLSFFDRVLENPPIPSLPPHATTDATKTGVKKGNVGDA